MGYISRCWEKETMKLTQKQTKKQQVLTALEKNIHEGILKPGDRLQGIRALALEFGVSTIVIKEAYKILKKNGLIKISQKKGVFVNPGFVRGKSRLVLLLTDARQENIEHYYDTLFQTASECNVYVVTVLVKKDDIERQISHALEQNPDLVLIDIEARNYSYSLLEALLAGIHHRYIRRWEWDEDIIADTVVCDYTGTYIRGLDYLMARGHSKILFLGYHEHPQKFLLKIFSRIEEVTGLAFGKELIYYAVEETLHRFPENLKQTYDANHPTAIMGMSDYLLYKLHTYAEYNCPALCALDRIGVFDLHFSRIPGMEHPSIPFDYLKLWHKSLESSYYQTPKVIPPCKIVYHPSHKK